MWILARAILPVGSAIFIQGGGQFFFILPTYSATMEDFSWFNFNFLCLKINLKKNKDASSKGLNNENKKNENKKYLKFEN